MKIKTSKTLTFAKGKHSWTINPNMGVVSHFPSHVCDALIQQGAVEVARKKPPKGDAAEAAE